MLLKLKEPKIMTQLFEGICALSADFDSLLLKDIQNTNEKEMNGNYIGH